ncbi:Dynein light chain [Sparganum proliferum]
MEKTTTSSLVGDDEWLKGNGDFYVTSKSTVTNKRMDISKSAAVEDYSQYSDTGKGPADSSVQYTSVSERRTEEHLSPSDYSYQRPRDGGSAWGTSGNPGTGTAIHVEVRPHYPAVEVPIRRSSVSNVRYSSTPAQRDPGLRSSRCNTLIVETPTVRGGYANGPGGTYLSSSDYYSSISRRAKTAVRQSSDTRVISKMTIPPLTPTLPRSSRQERSYSADLMQNEVDYQYATSRRSRYPYKDLPEYLQRTTLRDQILNASRENDVSRSKPRSRSHHHHHYCYYCDRHRHLHRSSSRPKTRDPNDTVRSATQLSQSASYAYPGMFSQTPAVCPTCQTGFAPMTPLHVQAEDLGGPVLMPSVPYLASPAVSTNFYSLPRRFAPQSAKPPRPPMTIGPASGWTPLAQTPYPTFMFQRPPSNYHCVCCPLGQHQVTKNTARRSNIFNFEHEGWSSEGNTNTGNAPNASESATLTKNVGMRVAHQKRMETAQSTLRRVPLSTAEDDLDKPVGAVNIPVQSVQLSPSPGADVSGDGLGGSFLRNTKTNITQESAWSMQSPGSITHGEVTREDGFPLDYVDLIDASSEYVNGADSEEDDDASMMPPDKKVVLAFAEAAIKTFELPVDVAACLKKSMDDHYGPVWQVIAGRGAYGSNIASMKDQLLHFKVHGWAFLLWKTSTQ